MIDGAGPTGTGGRRSVRWSGRGQQSQHVELPGRQTRRVRPGPGDRAAAPRRRAPWPSTGAAPDVARRRAQPVEDASASSVSSTSPDWASSAPSRTGRPARPRPPPPDASRPRARGHGRRAVGRECPRRSARTPARRQYLSNSAVTGPAPGRSACSDHPAGAAATSGRSLNAPSVSAVPAKARPDQETVAAGTVQAAASVSWVPDCPRRLCTRASVGVLYSRSMPGSARRPPPPAASPRLRPARRTHQQQRAVHPQVVGVRAESVIGGVAQPTAPGSSRRSSKLS